jgi:glycosyltransferase involved in cell wall biosynthesis
MQKPTLLIVIDNLQKGGAEVLLVGILTDLNQQFDVVLVTLSSECDFAEEKIRCRKKYELGFRNKYSIFKSISKLKEILEIENPSFIHSNLFYSSVIARMASPDSIPVFYSLHNEMSKNVFNGSKILTLLEKRTLKQNHFPIAVSENVKKDYEKIIGRPKNIFVLPNYISKEFFEEGIFKKSDKTGLPLKLVAVGNIKRQKNYLYLAKAFEQMKDLPVILDIYGAGNEKETDSLNSEIDKNNLPIHLKGKANDVSEILSKYDLLVSSSLYEGFGISVVEAMAKGLPVLLSDLPVFHEITLGNALFFDVNDSKSFANLIKEILEKKHDLHQLSQKGILISKRYNKENYLEKLFNIYHSVLDKKPVHFETENA